MSDAPSAGLVRGRYVSVPTEIEAIRWRADHNDSQVNAFCGGSDALTWRRIGPLEAQVFDRLHDTWVRVFEGQWVIRGTEGEFYPCEDEVFRKKYRPAEQFDGSGSGS